MDEAAGSANSYLFLAALNAAAALPLAVAPHTVSAITAMADMFACISLVDVVSTSTVGVYCTAGFSRCHGAVTLLADI